MEHETTHLLWTGGWDSTFRLLDLLLVKQRVVQPYYLIDPSRRSFKKEIQTIATLRNVLFERAPQTQTRLLPTVIKVINDIQLNPMITEQYKRLFALDYLGPQCEWLARFADEAKLFDLELSIHKDDRSHGFLEHCVVQEPGNGDSFYRLQANPSNPDLQLFKFFRFPLFDLTKLDMQTYATVHEYADILEHTWFCHSPLRNGSPCGTCGPCRYTRAEGLSRRIPIAGQLRFYSGYQIKRTLSKLIRH